MKDMFIDYQRAKRRIQARLKDEPYSGLREPYSGLRQDNARVYAIIQTWAEVTNQTWQEAEMELVGKEYFDILNNFPIE
jgi:hypothetical protein